LTSNADTLLHSINNADIPKSQTKLSSEKKKPKGKKIIIFTDGTLVNEKSVGIEANQFVTRMTEERAEEVGREQH